MTTKIQINDEESIDVSSVLTGECGRMESIVWEVIMKNKVGRVWNGFFRTLQDAEKKYHEYVSLDWSGDVFRREVCYD